MTIRAVLFDLGGVVLDSPLAAILRFEREHSIEMGFIGRHIARRGAEGSFAALERGELDIQAFGPAFREECAALGVSVDGSALIRTIISSSAPRGTYLRAIRVIRDRGLVAAALTNNWKSDQTSLLAAYFDVFLESSKLGLRKPDPRIYELACERIGATPTQIAYLDDLGVNLKPARQMGMTTIRVSDGDAALRELEKVLGFSLA